MGAELKDVTAEMDENPEVEDTSSESQADEMVVEADADTTETVVEEDDTSDSEPEAEAEGDEDADDGSSSEDEEEAFFEKPGVKKRLEGLEEKYGSKATYWDTLAEISQNDPEFRDLMVERLERAGKLPAGTAERIKGNAEQVQQEAQEANQYLEKLPKELQADIYAMREFRQQQEMARAEQGRQTEEFLAGFESDKPDIAKSPNPKRARSLIYNMAVEFMDRGVEKDFKTAMEKAYYTTLHPEKAVQTAKGDGVVEGLVQANLESSSGLSSGKGPASTAVKLSQEERRAAEVLGFTPEEYRKYKDTDDEELFENI